MHKSKTDSQHYYSKIEMYSDIYYYKYCKHIHKKKYFVQNKKNMSKIKEYVTRKMMQALYVNKILAATEGIQFSWLTAKQSIPDCRDSNVSSSLLGLNRHFS
jgi:hypothetical protein